MRQFGPTVANERRSQIIELAEVLFKRAPKLKGVNASQLELEVDNDPIVVHEADIRFGEDRLRIAKSVPEYRPPFEWLMEITSNVGETDYFKHYLILDDGIMLAQRKVLTPIDDVEAEVIMADLRLAAQSL